MKIDFDMLDKMVAAGATGAVVVAFLREIEARKAPKRVADKTRMAGKRTAKRATARDKHATPSDIARHDATLSDTPRARLFREGTAALMTLGRTEQASRGLIAGWLKQTGDDEQLVTATILRAQSMAVADAAGWITASLKSKAPGGQRPAKPMTAIELELQNSQRNGKHHDDESPIDGDLLDLAAEPAHARTGP